MYKYQCSKNDCGTSWNLKEGNLNGFVLTCPVCSKGRGLFSGQIQNRYEHKNKDGVEEMVIMVDGDTVKTVEEFTSRIDEFIRKHSLKVVSKDIESTGKNITCSLQYKLGN